MMILGPFTRADKAHIDENKVVSCFLLGLDASGCMLDIGAHQGGALKPFAEMGWTIYALEPDADNRSIMESRIQDWAGNVIIDTRAVSSKSGEIKSFYISEESTGISSLFAFTKGHEFSHKVETITLCDLVKLHNISKIDYLKIDVEGAEMDVFKGFDFDPLPTVVCAEFEDAKTKQKGYLTQDLVTYLQERDYKVFVSEWHPVVRYGIRHDWLGFYEYTDDNKPSEESWGNLVAVVNTATGADISDPQVWETQCRFYNE